MKTGSIPREEHVLSESEHEPIVDDTADVDVEAEVATEGAAGIDTAAPTDVHLAAGRPRLITLLGILALALGLRGLAWQRALMMMNDGPDFLWQALRFLDGEWSAALSHPYHPLFAGLTALVAGLRGVTELGSDPGAAIGLGGGTSLETSALAVSVAGGLLVVVATWGLAKLAFPNSPRVPACAALVAAVAARFVAFSSDVQSDGLFAGLSLAAVWALVSAAQRGACGRRLAAAGLLTGLAYLTRPEGLFVCFALVLWLVAQPGALRSRVRGVLLFTGGALLLVLPYVVALHQVTGVWGLSLKPSLQFAGLSDSTQIQPAPAGSPMSWAYVPTVLGERRARKAAEELPPRQGSLQGTLNNGTTWLPMPGLSLLALPPLAAKADWGRALNVTLKGYVSALRGELVLLALLGIVPLLRQRRSLAMGLLAMQLGWLAVSCWHVRTSDYITNRHFLMAHALLLPIAGAGLLSLWTAGKSAAARPWLRNTLRTLAVLCLVVSALAGTAPRRDENGPRLEALAWVSKHTSVEQSFATHRHRDGWYAHRVAITTRMPVKDRLFARRVQEQNVRYLVFDEDKLLEHQPHWIEQGLVSLVQSFEGEGDTVLVLEPHFGDLVPPAAQTDR